MLVHSTGFYYIIRTQTVNNSRSVQRFHKIIMSIKFVLLAEIIFN